VGQYLEKYAFRPKLISGKVDSDLGLVVVIPCCNEQALIGSLQSLYNCQKPDKKVEVITVINASENSAEEVVNQNRKTFREALEWSEKHVDDWISFYFIEENSLPKKHAGVGLARKIGMDEAVRRFDEVGNGKGLIVCFDADSKCEQDYLVEIEKHFKSNPNSPACSIHFEHPIHGDEFDQTIYSGIAQYELHLRYYKNCLKYAGLPYAYHTIGSSMAVTKDAYQKQNGMNKRKAGEDFYFLQKIIPLGGFTEIKTTKVIPSPRMSDRVPFGTGRAMQEWLNSDQSEMTSYNIQSVEALKFFVSEVPKLYAEVEFVVDESIMKFLDTVDFESNLINIRENSRSKEHFVELFFKWFNAFKVLKYMHFARDNHYPNTRLTLAAKDLLNLLEKPDADSIKGLLEKYREIDLS
jgi:hypothetical protein